jgi:hypothetical protein
LISWAAAGDPDTRFNFLHERTPPEKIGPSFAPMGRPTGLHECSALIIGGLLRRLNERVLARDHGGSGIEELEQLAAPISAVQLVFASMGAPANR